MMNRIFVTMMLCGTLTAAAPAAAQPGPMTRAFKIATRGGLEGFEADDRADDLYNEGREAIEEGRYDRAIDRFNRVIELKSSRTDAATDKRQAWIDLNEEENHDVFNALAWLKTQSR